MYWLTIVSSVTGILSFIIAFIDYFKSWKPYLLHFGFLTAGVTIGIFLSMMERGIQQFDKGQIIYLIALICIVGFLIFFVYRYLTHTNEPLMITIIVIVVISYFSVRLLNSVEASQSFIKSNDYLILSNYYLQKSEYTKSADFLQKYRDIETINLSRKILDSIDNNVEKLRWKSVKDLR